MNISETASSSLACSYTDNLQRHSAELPNVLETSLMVKCQHISRLIEAGAWQERGKEGD